MNRKRNGVLFLAIGMALALVATTAVGSTLTLSDSNSVVQINPTGGTAGGINSWTLNSGPNNLTEQWFWYAIGGGSRSTIDTLGTPVITGTSAGPDRTAYLVYSGSNGLSVEVDYLLTGGATGSQQGDLGETIRLTNSNSTAMTLHFFEYSNYNLSNGSADTLQFPGLNSVAQTNGTSSAQTVIVPMPNENEGALYPVTLGKLTTGTAALSNFPVPNTSGSVGPGNVTWTYEWDPTIAANSTYIISNDGQLISGTPTVGGPPPTPEPSTLALLFSGVLGVMGYVWRRRRHA